MKFCPNCPMKYSDWQFICEKCGCGLVHVDVRELQREKLRFEYEQEAKAEKEELLELLEDEA